MTGYLEDIKTVRLYGKTVEMWTATNERGRDVMTQAEIEYKEYNALGELVATGTEDFSRDRYKEITWAYVWTWDGERRNKGGHKWFERRFFIKFRKAERQTLKRYLTARYPEAAEIQIRVF